MIVLNPEAVPTGHFTPRRAAIPAREPGGYSSLLPEPALAARNRIS